MSSSIALRRASFKILCDEYNLSYAQGIKQEIDEFVNYNKFKFEIIFERFAKIEKS